MFSKTPSSYNTPKELSLLLEVLHKDVDLGSINPRLVTVFCKQAREFLTKACHKPANQGMCEVVLTPSFRE